MRITLNNFRCHVHEEFDIPDKGLVLLSGESGSGKSTLLEAIFFTLYDAVKKPYSFGKKTCEVIFELNDMIITRTKSPNRLIVEKDGKKYEDDAAQGILFKKFGNTFEEFLVSSYIKQKKESSILSLSSANQTQLIEKISFREDKNNTYKKQVGNLIRKKESELERLHVSSKIHKENIQRLVENSKNFDQEKFKDFEKETDINILFENATNNKLSCEKNIRELFDEKERLKSSIESCEREEEEQNKFKNERNELSVKISCMKTQLKNVKYSFSYEELTEKEKRLEELEKDIDEREKYMLAKDLEREYRTKYDEKIAEYDEKINISSEFILSEKELEMYKRKLNDFYVVPKGSKTPKEARDILLDVLKEVKTKYKTGNVKSSNAMITLLTKKNSLLLKNIKLNEDRINEYRIKIATLNITKSIYSCPCCKKSLMFKDDKLVEFFERKEQELNYEEMLQDCIKEQTDNKIELERNKKWIQNIKEVNDIASHKNYMTSEERDKMVEKISIHNIHKTNCEKYKKLRDEGIMPQSIDSIINSVTEIKRQLGKINHEISLSEVNKEMKKLSEILKEYYTNKSITNSLTNDINLLEQRLKLVDKKLENKKLHDLNFYKSRITDIDILTTEVLQNLEQSTKYLSLLNEYKIYLNYKKEIKYNSDKINAFELSIKNIEKDINSAINLKSDISNAEIIALQKTINNINEHSKYYLDMMFDNSPISVSLNTIKHTKNNSKFQLNTIVQYKGEIYDNISQLSGGERDRVNLSYILGVGSLLNSKILLLDECLSSLDGDTNTEILEFLRELAKDKCILVVSHEAINGIFDHTIYF